MNKQQDVNMQHTHTGFEYRLTSSLQTLMMPLDIFVSACLPT